MASQFTLFPACLLFLLPSVSHAQAANLEPSKAETQEHAPKPSPPASLRDRTDSSSSALSFAESLERRLWLVDPRVRPGQAEDDLLRFGLHGEYNVRYGSVPNVALDSYGFEDYKRKLGQSHRLEHRLRFSPILTYRKSVTLRAQFDLPQGMLVGQPTDHVTSDPEPLNETQPMRFAPRWLYVEVAVGRGTLSVGQQPSRWALGLVDDSGDNRQFLGDPRFGTVVERMSFVGRPLGKRVPWELLVATDLVYSDGRISLANGDRAVRAVLGNSYVASTDNRVGLLVIAQRLRPHYDDSSLRRIAPKETTLTIDLGGQTAQSVPGVAAKLFAGAEVAYVLGQTDLAAEVLSPNDVRVSRLGALARVGIIQTKAKSDASTGPLGLALEWGYASGDANPGDGVDKRFTMNPGRRVGLVLFDEALRWKTARSATALNDPRLGQRDAGTSWAVPSAGAVASATYLSLQFLYRPLPPFDIRAAATVAQSSSDLVDPAQVVIRGRYDNFDGGRATHRDLGAELDTAIEYRKPLENGLCASFGAEAATLFPGKALADASGRSIGTQYLLRGRFGFYF